MQTITVNIKTKSDGTAFEINGRTVADVHTHSGEYYAEVLCGITPTGQLPEQFNAHSDAVKYISDTITDHFAAFGLNVEFVNA